MLELRVEVASLCWRNNFFFWLIFVCKWSSMEGCAVPNMWALADSQERDCLFCLQFCKGGDQEKLLEHVSKGIKRHKQGIVWVRPDASFESTERRWGVNVRMDNGSDVLVSQKVWFASKQGLLDLKKVSGRHAFRIVLENCKHHMAEPNWFCAKVASEFTRPENDGLSAVEVPTANDDVSVAIIPKNPTGTTPPPPLDVPLRLSEMKSNGLEKKRVRDGLEAVEAHEVNDNSSLKIVLKKSCRSAFAPPSPRVDVSLNLVSWVNTDTEARRKMESAMNVNAFQDLLHFGRSFAHYHREEQVLELMKSDRKRDSERFNFLMLQIGSMAADIGTIEKAVFMVSRLSCKEIASQLVNALDDAQRSLLNPELLVEDTRNNWASSGETLLEMFPRTQMEFHGEQVVYFQTLFVGLCETISGTNEDQLAGNRRNLVLVDDVVHCPFERWSVDICLRLGIENAADKVEATWQLMCLLLPRLKSIATNHTITVADLWHAGESKQGTRRVDEDYARGLLALIVLRHDKDTFERLLETKNQLMMHSLLYIFSFMSEYDSVFSIAKRMPDKLKSLVVYDFGEDGGEDVIYQSSEMEMDLENL